MNEKSAENEIIVDTSVMISLYGKERPDRFRKILSIYVRSSEKDLADIHKAFAEKSLQAISDLMHKMKSSSSSLGIVKMIDFCVVCEQAAKDGDWAVLNQKIASLDGIWAEVVEFQKNY